MVLLGTAAAMAIQGATARLPKRHQDWISGPVSYLITKVERQTFHNLQTDEERDRFIERFWELRNPTPGHPQNEFKDEFFRRVEYANAHYGRYNGTEGWRSDMGKTYILFGRPQTTMNYTANQELHPTELWFYANPGLAEIPPFFYVIFFERDDISGYRLYNPMMDGPEKLIRDEPTKAQAYNYLRGVNAELARASLSLIPGEPVDTDTYSGSMESMTILNAIQGYREMPSYAAMIMARMARNERITTHIEYDLARTSLTAFATYDLGEQWLHWQLAIEDPLQPKAKNGRVEYDIAARLYSRTRLVFERLDAPAFDAPAGGEEALKRRVLTYEDRMPLVPGEYRLEVTARNRATEKTYESTKEIVIPNSAERTSLSEVLVVARTETNGQGRPFQFAGVKFALSPGGRVRATGGLHILYQVIAAAPRPPEYEVEYVVGSVTTKFRKTFQDRLDLSRSDNGALLTAKTLPIDELSPGAYQVAVRVKDPQTGRVTASSAPFVVIGAQDEPAPISISRGGTGTPQWTAINQYERALCWLAQDRPAEAVTSLEASWKLNQNRITGGLLQHLYEQTGQKSRAIN